MVLPEVLLASAMSTTYDYRPSHLRFICVYLRIKIACIHLFAFIRVHLRTVSKNVSRARRRSRQDRLSLLAGIRGNPRVSADDRLYSFARIRVYLRTIRRNVAGCHKTTQRRASADRR